MPLEDGVREYMMSSYLNSTSQLIIMSQLESFEDTKGMNVDEELRWLTISLLRFLEVAMGEIL